VIILHPLIPAKAGTQCFPTAGVEDEKQSPITTSTSPKALDPGFRRDERGW